MENASKALIIAGAILISILLISLGIVIYNSAKDAASTDQMDDFQVSAFNSKFTQYEGKKSGSQVKSLIDDVLACNANKDRGRKISVTGDVVTVDEGAVNATYADGFSINTKYTISCTRGDDGYVNSIEIK